MIEKESENDYKKLKENAGAEESKNVPFFYLNRIVLKLDGRTEE